MLRQPYQSLLLCSFLCLALATLFSCVNDSYREKDSEQEKKARLSPSRSEPMYKDIKLTLTTTQSAWKGNSAFKTKAEINSMQLVFDISIDRVPQVLIPLSESKKDTFAQTNLKMEVLFNGKPLAFNMPDPEKGWLRKSGLTQLEGDKIMFESGVFSLREDSKDFRFALPLFVFSAAKANSAGTVSVHVWQEYFVGPDKHKETRMPVGPPIVTYYNDTLRTRLIDNTYSFSLTVPQIYRTDIFCDSIVLQNDAGWSPSGSDNTIFKSSYPDIYYTLSDLYDNKQSSSETQKSTDRFTLSDSLPYYHYRPSEPFYITVYDYDVLSQDDVLGHWKGQLGSFENNKTYPLKFDHIRPFYFRKKEYGQINK